MQKSNKIDWHGAFPEAMKLELHEYADVLTFHTECQLSKEALRMDLLIIKKHKNVQIKKNIGRIFRGHNIFEYARQEATFSK